MEMEVKAIDGCPESEYADWVRLHIRRERRWAAVLDHLVKAERADLIGILFDGVDKLQHLCWRFIDPACRPAQPTSWEQEMIDLCESYFRSLDGLLAEIVELGGPDATVVIASDHGFGPTRDVFHVNSWLESMGYLFWADPTATANDRAETDVGFAEMTRHVHALDWSRTLAFAATPSSQGIQIVDKVPGGSAPMPQDTRARIAAELAGALKEIRRPSDGKPLVEEVWTREEAFAGPFQALGPDLSMVLADGGTLSILPSETIVARREQPRGHHRWEGILIAAGPGIRAGVVVDELSIVDVAPLVLHRLGLPVPEDMTGRLPMELLTAEELAARPPRTAPAGPEPQAVTAPDHDLALEPEEQAALVGRLRALGYVE
jgi:predicted AlkP superfamily phosphohydrolase/phosphomutase